jgi:NAD(P)-dependent dehydrogenase (short-subunit alcohol dehydrogenase family)
VTGNGRLYLLSRESEWDAVASIAFESESANWAIKDIPPQTGKRIIVTGANSGIGWHTALELARAGAEVTITARSEAKAADAAVRIHRRVPNARLKTAILDLADLAKVRAFAAGELADPRPIDTLINNAGIMALPKRELTINGFERQFATNVLGPFLLSGLLLPAIFRATAPRIVTVSSEAHRMGGPVPVQDLNSERDYRPHRAYAKTKLENILFARELQRRAGDRLLAVACHPGLSDTNLFADSTLRMRLLFWAARPIIQHAAEGAQSTLFAATAAETRPGGYYGPGRFFNTRGSPIETEPSPYARDKNAAKRLFDELERIAGIRYPL